MPRALLITPDYPPSIGGIQLLLGRTTDELRRRGWEVQVVSRRRILADRLLAVGQRASLVELNARAVWRGRRAPPDVLLAGHVIAAPALAVLTRGRRLPSVTVVHADEVPAFPGLSRLALGRATKIIAVSRHARALAVEHGAAPGRVTIVEPGVDAPTASAARDKRPTIVTVARLADRYKGHDVLAQAMVTVRERVDDVRWVIVGDGPLRPELEATARRLGVDDCTCFLGAVDDGARDSWLSQAHVFAMPSRLEDGQGGEGFGIAFLEAGAHGLPVVAGAVGGALDAVVHGETGLLVDPTDPQAVAGALIGLLQDAPLRERMGSAGRARAARRTWTQFGADVDAILRAILTRDDRADRLAGTP